MGSFGASAVALLSHWEGEPIELWRTLWKVPYLEVHEVLGSTNDRAKDLIREEGVPWSLVLSEAQTAGRGRGGKRWSSPSGQGLWFSLLVPSGGTEWNSLLPLRVGMAMAQAIDGVLLGGNREVGPIQLKWPNDLILAGKKVGGILCEKAGEDWVVAGAAVNVHQDPREFPPELQKIADSLEGASGARVYRGRLMKAILGLVRDGLGRGGGLLEDEEMLEYSRRDALQGRRVESEMEGGGVARGITREGSLRLEEVGGGIIEVRAGSVVVT